MIKRVFAEQLIIIAILLRVSYAQDSISNNFHIKLGVEIIPGISTSWKSKDYEIYPYRSDNDRTIIRPFIIERIGADFYYKKVCLSVSLWVLSEKLLAHVSLPYGGQYFGVYPSYDLEYTCRYLDLPLRVGMMLNKNSEENKTFLEAGTAISFIFYERIKKFNSSDVYIGNNPPFNYNGNVITKKIKYNRICFLIVFGRETPFIKNTHLYLKRAITFITAPIDIKRNTTEIVTNMRFGINLGLSYKIK